MKPRDDMVFLFDCDNTLLDNDRVQEDLKLHLDDAFGMERCKRYWALVEELRAEPGYADLLGALETIEHCRAWGLTAIMSDGDVVLQSRKPQRSGLWDAVEGRVLIYIHKERMLDDTQRRFPARHYVMVEDKVRILADIKGVLRDRVTTVFPRQGHYAHDPRNLTRYPTADVTVERIADMAQVDLPAILGSATSELGAPEFP